MLCEDCNKREATIHKTKIVNGIKKETHLCGECAMKNEIFGFEDNFSIHNFLSNLLEGNVSPHTGTSYSQGKKCPQCHSRYDDFRSKGRLGCSVCYSTFDEMLSPLVRRVQGNNIHAGKIPKKSGASIRLRKNLTQLKHKLQDLIINEEFEEAAKVRDEIKELESKIDDS